MALMAQVLSFVRDTPVEEKMKTAPPVQPPIVPSNAPASQDCHYPPVPKTRSSSAPPKRAPVEEVDKVAQQKEMDQACRSFMLYLNETSQGPTADFEDELLRWHDNVDSRLQNYTYIHRSLLRSLVARQPIEQQVAVCLLRFCDLPETEGPRKGIAWGLPNWMVLPILLWVALWNPNNPRQGIEQPDKFSRLLVSQAKNQVITLLDICRLAVVMSEYIIYPAGPQSRMPRLFMNRLGLPPLPPNCYVAILRVVTNIFSDAHVKAQCEDLYRQLIAIIPKTQLTPAPPAQGQQPQPQPQPQQQQPQQQQPQQQQALPQFHHQQPQQMIQPQQRALQAGP